MSEDEYTYKTDKDDNTFYIFRIEGIRKKIQSDKMYLWNYNYSEATLVSKHSKEFPMDTSSKFIISDAPKSVLTEHWFKDLPRKDKEKMEEELKSQEGSHAVIFCLKTEDKLILYPYIRKD